MATPANLEILERSDLVSPEARAARPDDLLLAVRAETPAAAEAALGQADALLRERRSATEQDYRPRSLAAALRELPDASWVMVSVPGRWAGGLAREALERGRHVFLYTDNVPLAVERDLKHFAGERGLLVLGPDCGTAIVGGVGLGFANRLRRGGVGLIGASGTGLQAVSSRLHALGAGVSHALGTGGRDLREEVGGRTALQAIDLLGRDPETSVLVVLSKPPAPAVAARVLAAVRATGKPAVVHFLGAARPGRSIGDVHFATTLAEAAELAAELGAASGRSTAAIATPVEGFLRGLFSGGTLGLEALIGLESALGPIASNLHHGSTAGGLADGHRLLDLGDDELTVGRPHPMIDLGLLREHVRAAAAEPQVSVVLLDVVLGHGAHADPASELGPEIAAARDGARAHGRALEAVVILVGTEDDPQDVERQHAALASAGATVVRSVGEAVAWTSARLRPASPALARPVPLAALAPPVVVNAGLESFRDALLAQGASALQMDWRPPAGGDEKMAALLARLRGRGRVESS